MTTDAVMQGRTIGILGQAWRATVTPAGDVYPWDDLEAVRWYVAADDRWHVPADEVAVRQRSIDGAPVLETRVRIPGGDVIQRVWVASGRLGSSALMMEFENDSPMAIAIAIDRQGLLVSRPVAVRSAGGEWPAPGLDIPHEPTVIPVGHRTSARVALVVSGSAADLNIGDFADYLAVARGWVSLSERASRFTITDLRDSQRVDEMIVVERSEIALNPVLFSDAPDAAVRSVGRRPATGDEVGERLIAGAALRRDRVGRHRRAFDRVGLRVDGQTPDALVGRAIGDDNQRHHDPLVAEGLDLPIHRLDVFLVDDVSVAVGRGGELARLGFLLGGEQAVERDIESGVMDAEFQGVGNYLDLEALGAALGWVGCRVGCGECRQRKAKAGKK